jgi:tRNA-Thr(GGU) m(6)t(6)A37 methyltransferase TsaA
MEQMEITPIGEVRNSFTRTLPPAEDYAADPEAWKAQVRSNQEKIRTTVSQLVFRPEYVDLLDGIEEFSHALVLYWPHLIAPERRKLRKVHPMGRKDLPLTGIFATRSPARPNPILVSVVKIVERQKNILRVSGLEAVDGSPILDIKPHIKSYDTLEHPKVAPWMEQIQRDLEGEIAQQ